MDAVSYILSRKYTEDTAIGLGAVKGKSCNIQSITPTDDGNRVTFRWTGDDGTVQTSAMLVKNGIDGESIVSIEIDANNRLKCTLTDGAVIVTSPLDLSAEKIDYTNAEVSGVSNVQQALDKLFEGGASSEEQIKDWVSGETYEVGDYVYYDGKLYRCTTENSDVDFSGINWKNLSGSEGGDATEMEAESLTPSAVGGIPAGTDLNGLTSLEILTMMLYPYIKPTVSATGTPNGGTFEIGDNKTITNVRVVVGKKSKKITKVKVFDGVTSLGLLDDATIENGGTFDFQVNIEVASVNKQLTATVTDEQGSEVSAKTGAFTFVYPYYVGVCSDGVAIDETLVKGLTKKIESKGAKTIAYTTNNQRMVFAYPKSYGAIKSIIDPNNFDVTASFVQSTINITGLDGTAQSYYVYVNSASTQSNFTMKFSY